jgi:hypothetical protein
VATDVDLKQQANALYERYGRPLEVEHRGEYVAIAPDGRVVLASKPAEALLKGHDELGPGNFIFHVGNRFVVTWQ